VEINALWYNAICFALEAARAANDQSFVKQWEPFPSLIRTSFRETFWDETKKYLADCVTDGYKDWSVRPNQIFAVSLPFSPLEEHMQRAVLRTVENELLTPRGLRTLTLSDPRYRGEYSGDHRTRDMAYHQGTVWPWLLEHFAKACIKVKGTEGAKTVRSLYEGFSQAVFDYGIGTIPELYDGDTPHRPCGAVSQAWSVAALLRMRQLLTKYPHEVVVEKEQELVSEADE
jgi:glycogen debranching enzyme